MLKLMTLVFSFMVATLSANEVNLPKLVDAIYIVEGGTKASVPYGMLKYKGMSKEQLTPKCLACVTRYHKLWKAQGSQVDFIDYLGSHYAPTSGKGVTAYAAKINKNWSKVVKKVYASR
jgi:hypothetical protein